MKIEIEIPDPPDGCTIPEYRPLWLPIDPRTYVLHGGGWWKADAVVGNGGAFWTVGAYWIVCMKWRILSMPNSAPSATQDGGGKDGGR